MKINDLLPVHFEHSGHSCNHKIKTASELVSHYQPMLCGKVHDLLSLPPKSLTEATVKEIKSLFDDNFLRQKERSGDLDGFRKFGFAGDTITYYVPSSHYKDNDHFMRGKGYHCKVQFADWQQLAEDTDLNANEAARLLYWVGNVRLSCTCPSHLYYGFQYLLTAIDASVYPEIRKPVKMNPGERGIVCKHLRRLLDFLGNNLNDISTEVRNYRNSSPDVRQRELDQKRRQQELINQNKIKKQKQDQVENPEEIV